MALDDTDPTAHAKLLAQVLALKQQVNNLQAQNATLEAENVTLKAENATVKAKNATLASDLHDTHALLGETTMNLHRQSQATSVSRSPSLRYTPVTQTVSSLKRPRSPTLEYIDAPPPTKKGKERARTSDNISQPIASSSRQASGSRASVKVLKESPGKPTRLGFTRNDDILSIDDDSDAPPDTNPEDIPVPPTVSEMDIASNSSLHNDSDLEDPNVSIDEAVNEPKERVEGSPVAASGGSSSGSQRGSRPASDSSSLRRSGRFSSMTSLTTMSTLTPVPSTPGPNDGPETDRKPKREPKQEIGFHLPSSVTSLYLQSAEPLPIDPPPMTLEIPRKFLRLAYGGSDQQFVQFIPANRNTGPGKRSLVFPMLNLNPSMPSSPGASGLVFASRHDILHNPPWTLFCKRDSSKALWLYLGEYKSELVGKLTPEQFSVQTSEVKDRWARLIMTQQRQVCYMSMRARIALRAVGIIPLESKEREQELINQEVEKVKAGKGRSVTHAQIMRAFTNGDEGVDIIRMKCVKYDQVFANDIQKRFKGYPRLVAAAEAAKKRKASGKGAKSTSRSSRRKRKTNAASESDEDILESEEGWLESDEGDEAEAARATKGKGKNTPPKASTSKSTRTTTRGSESASPGPRRRRNPPIVDESDGVDDDAIYASEDAREGDAAWKPSSRSSPSTSGRTHSQRTRKPSQKLSDSVGANEH